MVKDNTEMKAQSKTPCTKGFMPTDVIRSFVRLDPIRNSVVLKFSNDNRKATTAPPIMDGLKYRKVINQMT